MQAAMLRYMMGNESTTLDQDRIWLKGDSGYQQFVNVQKLACQTGGDTPGARCDFIVESGYGSEPGFDISEITSSGRFVQDETSGNWQFLVDQSAAHIPRPVEIVDALMMTDMVESGGMTGCFDPSLSGRRRVVAERLGGRPCDQ